MKIKPTLFVSVAAAALMSASASAHAAGGKETNYATIDDHGFQGVDLSIEGAYLFSSGKLPYAQFDDGVSNSDFTMDPGDGWNGGASARFRFEGGWKFNVAYKGTRLNETADTGQYDDLNTATTWPVWNILSPTTTSYNQVVASSDTNVDNFDLSIGHDVGLGSGNMTLIGGLRYGVIQQNTSTTIYCTRVASACVPPVVEGTEYRQSEYRGFGPSLGFDYSVPLTDSGIGAFGTALGSVLFGKQETVTEGTGNASGTSTFSDHHIAYTLEGQAGLSYKIPDRPITLAAGYEVSWLNGVRDTQNNSSSTGTDSFGEHHADLLTHGAFIRLTVSLP